MRIYQMVTGEIMLKYSSHKRKKENEKTKQGKGNKGNMIAFMNSTVCFHSSWSPEKNTIRFCSKALV